MTQDTAAERNETIGNDASSTDPDLSVEEQETVEEVVLPEMEEDEDEPEPAVTDEEEDAAAEIDVVEQLKEELATAQAQADEYLDKLQRTAAEFQNSRRRQERQLSEETERANGVLIKRILPVLDDLDLAFDNMPASLEGDGKDDEGGDGPGDAESLSAWLDGFRQIKRKLLDVLAEEDVSIIEIDGPFDPMRHEAISSEPDDAVESGYIIGCMRAGYEYKGRVLRPALVRVAM